MGRTTEIGWVTSSWNPWQGCEHTSPGCDHCFMFRDKRRYGQDPTVVVRSRPATFNAPLKWCEPRDIFTCSWSDFFIAQADAWRGEAWEIIRRTPQHTYLILTKRPTRIAAHLPHDWGKGWPNVWLGVSVEMPAYLWRVDRLRAVPAAHRFLPLEPLLADLGALTLEGIDWVIVGGESGPIHRPMAITWVTSIAAQSLAAGVKLYIKQDAATRSSEQGRIPDALWAYKDRPAFVG
jgi:protein gp37